MPNPERSDLFFDFFLMDLVSGKLSSSEVDGNVDVSGAVSNGASVGVDCSGEELVPRPTLDA